MKGWTGHAHIQQEYSSSLLFVCVNARPVILTFNCDHNYCKE